MSDRASEAITVSLPNPRILLVDDDESFLEGLSDYFSDFGYVVDTARTPEEALKLMQKGGTRSYQLVVTDFDFGDLSRTEGDQFLLQNRPLFRGAVEVVVSGAADLTGDRRMRLERAGIRFLQKSRETAGRLEEMAVGAKERLASEIMAILAEEVAPRVEKLIGSPLSVAFVPRAAPSAASYVADQLKDLIIDWLMARGNPDKPAFAYGTQVYSARELAEEIRRGTTVGLAHVVMLVDEFKSSLGINHDGKGRDDDEPET